MKGRRRIIEPLPFLYEIRGSQCDTATPRHVGREDANVAPIILLFAARIAASSLVAVPAPVPAAAADA